MITPFSEDGVNLQEFGKMMEYQIANGTDALIVLGTTGEPPVMSDEEKVSLRHICSFGRYKRARFDDLSYVER